MSKRNRMSGLGVLAAGVVALTLISGCGEQSAPPPAAPTGPAKSTSEAPAMNGSMKDQMIAAKPGETAMSGPNRPAAAPAAAPIAGGDDKPVTTVYYDEKNKTFSLTPGNCAGTDVPMKAMPISNPDPGVCVVTGEKIEKHTAFGIAKGKAYAFCCDMCLPNLLDDPDGVVKKAQERADAAKDKK